MKTFELSAKNDKAGRRKFKLILHEIYPDDCIDTASEAGTKYNENGITWIEEYCQKNLDTLKDTSLKVEFIDEERTEIYGHGLSGVVDGVPYFENATIIGHFTDGYITDMEDKDGITHRVCVGEGYVDASCYPRFIEKIEEALANDEAPRGSVEVVSPQGADCIIYKYGYKAKGRIPTDFKYEGYALIALRPSDAVAKMVELNNKEDSQKMTEEQVKSIILAVLNETSNQAAELNSCKTECEAKVLEANTAAEDAKTEAETVRTALAQAKNELQGLYEKQDELYGEIKQLNEELGKIRTQERINALKTATAGFTDEQKEFAAVEINAFNDDPLNGSVDAIVSKIYEGIGIAAQKEQKKIAVETNAANQSLADIFGAIDAPKQAEEVNIF